MAGYEDIANLLKEIENGTPLNQVITEPCKQCGQLGTEHFDVKTKNVEEGNENQQE